jgi:hypothetical protein
LGLGFLEDAATDVTDVFQRPFRRGAGDRGAFSSEREVKANQVLSITGLAGRQQHRFGNIDGPRVAARVELGIAEAAEKHQVAAEKLISGADQGVVAAERQNQAAAYGPSKGRQVAFGTDQGNDLIFVATWPLRENL